MLDAWNALAQELKDTHVTFGALRATEWYDNPGLKHVKGYPTLLYIFDNEVRNISQFLYRVIIGQFISSIVRIEKDSCPDVKFITNACNGDVEL
jgi:hypothetical protein